MSQQDARVHDGRVGEPREAVAERLRAIVVQERAQDGRRRMLGAGAVTGRLSEPACGSQTAFLDECPGPRRRMSFEPRQRRRRRPAGHEEFGSTVLRDVLDGCKPRPDGTEIDRGGRLVSSLSGRCRAARRCPRPAASGDRDPRPDSRPPRPASAEVGCPPAGPGRAAGRRPGRWRSHLRSSGCWSRPGVPPSSAAATNARRSWHASRAAWTPSPGRRARESLTAKPSIKARSRAPNG